MIKQYDTPFTDPIRTQYFQTIYHWAQSIQMTPAKAYWVARKKTLKLYPL